RKEGFGGGRFSTGPAECLESLNRSLSIDKRLYKEDIKGSIAYATALKKANIITQEEETILKKGLNLTLQEWENGKISFLKSDEDVHTVNERRVKELIGSEIGGKLHTGRSRNDQVVTDMKLWMLENISELQKTIAVFVQALQKKSTECIDVLMPGYTHLQRGQPVRFSHWLLSHAWPLVSDHQRLRDLRKRVAMCPLGSGALAGNPLKVDRKALAEDLGFDSGPTMNSMHTVSDRDFVAEFLFDCSLCSSHLSRLAEDLIIFCSKEFRFISLDDGYSTGSSLMPQKRNPDSAELVRGMSGTIFGQLCGFMMTLKGLPSTYNKDLQGDKLAMFSAYDSLRDVLQVITGCICTMKINADVCRSALTTDMLATDLAYYLTGRGVAFRKAHKLTGEAVAMAEKLQIPLHQLSLSDLQKISPAFETSVYKIWDFEHSVDQYSSIGGTAKSAVLQQIQELHSWAENTQQK
ncbi:argininosuccinate lyase, partial [Ctenocephalides felis]|uniref:argininosuccinate lyase n=1 Tax=Ctenocephalides felis TaxID=7515 RepID=UPI000E6E1832